MSGSEKPVDETITVSRTSLSESVQTYSLEKIPQVSDSKTLNINLCQTFSLKLDKPVQTEPTSEKTTSIGSVKSRETVSSKTETSTSAESDYKELDSFDEFPENSIKKSTNSDSHDLEEEKSMDVRKKQLDSNKNAINNRTASDLERRKLEAELKATEEIARIKQSVIEKRLALELASIQDNTEASQGKPTQTQSPQADIKAIEETAMRKQSIVENNLARELDVIEFQNRVQAARPVHQVSSKLLEGASKLLKSSGGILVGPSPAASNPLDVGKGTNFKSNYPSSSDVKSVDQSDSRKFNLDLRTPGNSELRPATPTEVRYLAPTDVRYGQRVEDRNYPRQGQQPVAADFTGMRADYKSNSVWKSLMGKMKKKFKTSKHPATWE